MKIGDLSKLSGVSIRMLRYYEAQGLLSPRRVGSGYRDYAAADVQAVAGIRLLGAAGMTLPVIREFLPCLRRDRPEFEPCDALRIILRKQIDLLDKKVARLDESRQMLQGFLRELDS